MAMVLKTMAVIESVVPMVRSPSGGGCGMKETRDGIVDRRVEIEGLLDLSRSKVYNRLE